MAMSPATGEARTVARRQLHRVLLVLAVLDLSVLAWVIGLAATWSSTRFSVPVLLALMLGGIGLILGLRVALGVRLRRRSGSLT